MLFLPFCASESYVSSLNPQYFTDSPLAPSADTAFFPQREKEDSWWWCMENCERLPWQFRLPPPCTCRPGLCKLSITHYLMCSLPTQKTCITLLWPLTGGTVLRAFWDALPELNPQFGSNKIFPFFLINFSLTLFDQSVCMLSCSTVCNSFRPHGL